MSRVALTALLWAGFWTLALLLAGGLAWVPIAQLRYEGAPGPSGLLAGLGALTVLWALRPRGWFTKKVASSRLPIARADAEGLAAFVDGVASRLGAPSPHRVAFADHATAYVGVERRWGGLKKTVEVGIGLPLFALLGRDELSAVLAHEFGHQLGGDTALGPWVHRTHRSLAAAVEALDDSAFFLDVPFRAYGQLFLRVSAQVSREQERTADRRSAQVYGAPAAASALRVVHGIGTLWDVYFDAEVEPLLHLGVRVPLLEGFRQFLAEPVKRPEVVKAIEAIVGRPPSPWDSHPTLAERLASLGEAAVQEDAALAGPQRPPPSNCLDLLGGEAAAEDLWYRIATNGKMTPLRWDEVGQKALLPAMREALEENGLTPATADLEALPQLLAEGGGLWERLRKGGVDLLSAEGKRQRSRRMLTDWFAVSLWWKGFEPVVRPGAALRLRRGPVELDPAQVIEGLVSGRFTAADHLELCEAIARTGTAVA